MNSIQRIFQRFCWILCHFWYTFMSIKSFWKISFDLPKLGRKKKLWLSPSIICKKYAMHCTFAFYIPTKRKRIAKNTKIYMLLYKDYPSVPKLAISDFLSKICWEKCQWMVMSNKFRFDCPGDSRWSLSEISFQNSIMINKSKRSALLLQLFLL